MLGERGGEEATAITSNWILKGNSGEQKWKGKDNT